jgi:hypothetical protein
VPLQRKSSNSIGVRTGMKRTVLAIQKWRFAPALKDGEPVESRMDISLPVGLTCFSARSIPTRTCPPSPPADSTVHSDSGKRRWEV